MSLAPSPQTPSETVFDLGFFHGHVVKVLGDHLFLNRAELLTCVFIVVCVPVESVLLGDGPRGSLSERSHGLWDLCFEVTHFL